MAKKGDILTDFVTAPWYNKVNKAIDLRTGLGTTHSPVIITVYNHSTTPRKVWEPVSLGTSKIDYTDYPNVNYNNIAFNTKALSSTDPHNIAILQQPLEGIVGASADAMLMGVSWLRMPEALVTFDRVKVSSSNTLRYYHYGKIRAAVNYQIGGSEWLALVTLGQARGSILFRYQLLGDFLTGVAQANIKTMSGTLIEEATIYDPELVLYELETGHKGYCIYQEEKYWAIQAPCPPDMVEE